MGVKIWRGDAQAVRNVWRIDFTNVEDNSTVKITINRKDLSFSGVASSLADLFADAIEESEIPEWQEVEVEASGYYLTLTGPEDGTPVIVSVTATPFCDIVVNVTQAGVAGSNEKQTITISTSTGGTFTLTYDGQTTSALAYNVSAADMATALKALSNIGDSDVAVTGNAGGPWTVEFQGTLASTNVALITGDGASLTGSGTVTITEETAGSAQRNTILRYAIYGTGTPLVEFAFSNVTDAAGISDSADKFGTMRWYGGANYWVEHLPGEGGPSETITLSSVLTYMLGAGNFTLTAETPVAPDYYQYYRIEVKGTYAAHEISLTVTLTESPSDADVSVITHQVGTTGIDEEQLVVVANATGGTFTLTFGGQTTSDLAYNISIANMTTALEALSSIGSGNVTVTAPATGQYLVTFGTTLGSQDVALMTASAASLTGGTVTVETTQAAVGGLNEIQQVAIAGATPTGGTFVLAYSGVSTSDIAYNASAATVSAALEALSSIGASNVAVTGDAGGPWTVTFQGTLAATDAALLVGYSDDLTVAAVSYLIQETTEATGPHHFSDPKNWDANAVPADGDDIVFQSGSSDCLFDLVTYQARHYIDCAEASAGTFTLTYYGSTTAAIAFNANAAAVEAALDLLSSVGAGNVAVTSSAQGVFVVTFSGTLCERDFEPLTGSGAGLTGDTLTITQGLLSPAAIKVYSSYTGKIGLPDWNELGYTEYRDRTLRIGDTNDAQTIAVEIGLGEGSGSGRIRINTGAAQTVLTVYDTGSAADYPWPAVIWQGTHASNTAKVYKGSVGIGVGAGETTVLSTLDVGHASSQDSDAEVVCGQSVTLGTITKSGGTLLLDSRSGSAITLITHHAGTMTIDGTDGVTQLTILGGTVYYSTSGTLAGNPAVSGDGRIDFSRDMRAKTVTNPIDVYGDEATVYDPYKKVTSLVVDWNNTTRYDGLGRDIRVTRGATA
jgi:hypothetical protein